MYLRKKHRLVVIFQTLSEAYQECGLSGLNAERVQDLTKSMNVDGGFFAYSFEDQRRYLNFMKEIHIGRGEMFYALEKSRTLDSSFWQEFKTAIEEYIEEIGGKSYFFPEK